MVCLESHRSLAGASPVVEIAREPRINLVVIAQDVMGCHTLGQN